MTINPKIFKAYDIRGVYPTEIDYEGAERIIRAIYTLFKDKIGKETFTVLLGRDMRTFAPELYETAKNALLQMGANVIDGGLITTPTFYYAVWHYGYDAGIQLTASHNPKEYAGIKFVVRTENGLLKIGKNTGMNEVKELATGDQTFENAATPGTVTEKLNILEDEVQYWSDKLENPTINNFKIVADPANAMGGLYIEALVKKYPMDLVRMNFELDGTFPVHQPDPLEAKNLVDLQKRVVEENADLGLAPDGDGDRLFFIDEKGQIVPPSIITSLVSRELLKKNPGETIVVDIRYLLTPKKIVAENGGNFEIVRVGHAFITEKLHQTNGIFAGESSAHYFFRDTGGGEAQIPVMMLVMKVMTEEGKKLSELVEEFRRSYESGEFNFRVTNAQEIMDHIKEKYADAEITTVDCIELSYPDWRFSIRTSNTEPLLRLNVEAYDKAVMEQKRDEVMQAIKDVAVMDAHKGH